MPAFSISREDWSLHPKGEIDRQRHQEKVREALRGSLADIVSEESIILSDGNQVIRVPIRSLEEYKFRYSFEKQAHAGQGDGHSRVGDVLDPASGSAPGKGKEAGEHPGVEYYEAEITVDELAELLFEELQLPRLRPRREQGLTSEAYRFNDVRRQGISSNIDKRRTLLEALRRNAREGRPGLHRFFREDLRYKTWESTPRNESNAVILAMMDTSGSMGTFEKYLVRTFFFWAVRFLRQSYRQVEILFITHDVEAREVMEKEFFTRGESGGTRCSSAYQLALDIIGSRYRPDDYNLYVFHFTDGENLLADNERCVELVRQLLPLCNLVGYGEICPAPYYHRRSLIEAYSRIKDPRFVAVPIRDKTDLGPALKAFFGPQLESTTG